MQDILIKLQNSGLYDLQLNSDGTDFESVEGFDTAIPIAFFTDKRADKTFVSNSYNRRGWIGNILTKDDNFELGSLLWTLEQAKLGQIEINNSQIFAKDSLQEFLDIGAANSIIIITKQTGVRTITIYTLITDDNNEISSYKTLWRGTNADNI